VHDRAEDTEGAKQEAEQRARFLTKLAGMIPEPVLTAFQAHPDRLVHLMRIVGGSVFTADPEQDEDSRVQAVQAALEAAAAMAGSIAAAQREMASTAAREALAARVRRLWTAKGKGISERARVQIVRNKLGPYAPSRSTILRMVKPTRK
jgi:hypothetical protein